VVVQSSTANSYSLPNAAAGTYCFQVTAFDREGNSKAGAVRCAAVALDDRSLTYTGLTARTAPPAALDGTVTRLTGAGSTSFTCSCRALGIMFRRGSDVGKAGVAIDGRSRKNVDLYSTGSKVLWWTQAFPSVGPHTVTVSWTGLKSKSATTTDVAIDGVGAIADAAPQPA
jgi:hypothetical protein